MTKKSKLVSERRRRIKRMALAYKNNKCIICGYNRSKRSLHFHHINPKNKKFGISTGHCRSWERVKKELDKCVLVCSNCHGEITDGLIKIVPILSKINNDNIIDVNSLKIKKYVQQPTCYNCDVNISYRTKTGLCIKCYRKSTRKVQRPSLNILTRDIKQLGYCGTGRKYGVTDNAIRKWIGEIK